MNINLPALVSIVETDQTYAPTAGCRSKVIWGARQMPARLMPLRRAVVACALLMILPLAQPLLAQTHAETGWVAVNTNAPATPISGSLSAGSERATAAAQISAASQATAPVWTPSSGCAPYCGDVVKSNRRPIALPALYAGLGLLQGLDLYSTSQALKYGAYEANPFMARVSGNRAASIAMKGASSAAIIYFAERLRKKSPVAAVTMMVIANGVTAGIVAHNFRNARMLSARR